MYAVDLEIEVNKTATTTHLCEAAGSLLAIACAISATSSEDHLLDDLILTVHYKRRLGPWHQRTPS
jgi:hypothetical protein